MVAERPGQIVQVILVIEVRAVRDGGSENDFRFGFRLGLRVMPNRVFVETAAFDLLFDLRAWIVGIVPYPSPSKTGS